MINVRFYRDPSRCYAVSCYVWRDTKMGRVPYKVTIEELPELQSRFAQWDPSAIVEEDLLQAVVKGLQEDGFLPKMGAVEAELIATQKHLDDMRSLAFESVPPKSSVRE